MKGIQSRRGKAPAFTAASPTQRRSLTLIQISRSLACSPTHGLIINCNKGFDVNKHEHLSATVDNDPARIQLPDAERLSCIVCREEFNKSRTGRFGRDR